MPKPSQANEVFRFVCARPAQAGLRSIRIPTPAVDQNGNPIPPFSERRKPAHTEQITALAKHLALDWGKISVGMNTALDTKVVRDSIKATFPHDNLASLVDKDDWNLDEAMLNFAIYRTWSDTADPQGTGPELTRERQLYDLVRQAADPNTGEKGYDSFVLAGMALDPAPTQLMKGTVTVRDAQTSGSTDTSAADVATAHEQIHNLIEALQFLNSSEVLLARQIDNGNPSNFLLQGNWIDMLPDEAKTAVTATKIGLEDRTVPQSITHYYSIILSAIKATMSTVNKSPAFKSGLFAIGPFNLELKSPWQTTLDPAAAVTVPSSDSVPDEKPSKIKPTGVGDLLVVRDHVYEYIGGDIGAIQNVLKSEALTHTTRQLDRTEVVQTTSTETQTETDKEDTSTTRFALNKEANNVIKQDSSSKAGASISASYGPYVTVKGDISSAQNNSTETSNKVASQYSQDITSRATSKIIEKTTSITTKTTISQFTELNKHEFDNKGAGSSNISGVYQWINKVSRCQMYNYGKRLLIDITIPEPAAFLMNASGDANPILQAPAPLTESASDINESNYSTIAARYQATGLKPPGDILTSFSKSFKADITPDNSAVKPGEVFSRHAGGNVSITQDLQVPNGYLAYAAVIQVGVRTPPVINQWTLVEESDQKQWFPLESPTPRTPDPFVSVAGRLVKAGVTTASVLPASALTGLTQAQQDAINNALNTIMVQDTAGTIIFDSPLVSDTIALSISQDFCLALSGSIQIFCIRQPSAYTQWQQDSYDAIQAAYTKMAMDYQRAVSEAAISTLSVTTGDNPLENTVLITNELKKTAISFMTAQNYERFGTVTSSPPDNIPEVTESAQEKALAQGTYADFFEKAFEWENMTYALYPYFWASRSSWRQRIGFHSPDPTFSAFVQAGMAKVTVPARLGFGLEVIHMLESGNLWQDGPISTLVTSQYYAAAQEILAAEANPSDVKVSDPWYTVVPTDLVQLRVDAVLPKFKQDENGVWVERPEGEADDDNA